MALATEQRAGNRIKTCLSCRKSVDLVLAQHPVVPRGEIGLSSDCFTAQKGKARNSKKTNVEEKKNKKKKPLVNWKRSLTVK